MAVSKPIEQAIRVAVENVGGIEQTEVGLEPGVNVLRGRNATNRTSFLQAIVAALGGEDASLKGDAESGHVELTYDGDTYERRLDRRGDRVVLDGDPYTEDPELAGLFAFLLESNEARRAVGRGEDLRELLMRPVDTDELEREIDRAKSRRASIDEELEGLEELEAELPTLERRRNELETEAEEVEQRLEAVRDRIDDLDVDVAARRASKQEIEETFAELRSARADLEDVEYDLETERESRRELEREREELEAELDELDEPQHTSLERLEGRIRELRERKQSLEATLTDLQSVIRFNEERLDDGGLDLGTALGTDDAQSVADELVDGGETVCWTCGSSVDPDRIEGTLERLESLRRTRLDERSALDAEIDELAERREEVQSCEQNRERIESRLAEIDDQLDRHDDRIEAHEAERAEGEERVEALEAETESFEDADFDDALELHREANELELERERLRDNRSAVEERIVEIETRLDDREELHSRRDAVVEELTELRTRVDRLETEAVEAFNEHMESIRSILGYENVDRIWIERRETTSRQGRTVGARTAFDLHVVRSTAEGRSYEDTVDHLSESEREVTGLVFALAGYLVHDVHDVVPFVLLDSLEAMDAERIAALVEYFEAFADCLVVALLPEDADALPEDYHYVTDV